MTFASSQFLIFFAFVFSVYFLLPLKFRNIFLLVASYYFYAVWSIKFLFLLIFTMVLDYFSALLIESSDGKKRKIFLIVSLTLNLGILFVFKYVNLFLSILSSLLTMKIKPLDIILPFGISFYTFHAMSYVIDVYRRAIKAEKNFIFYSGYVMFFPQLVAGPIARASHLLHQFEEKKYFKKSNLVSGTYLILRGYFLKSVLADNLSPLVDSCWGLDLAVTPTVALQGIVFFAFQIYFDFAGYSDLARGFARLLDFDLNINFLNPYLAVSITDFWRRWHISLSTWLRDYLYISLGGNRSGKFKTYLNLLITMLLGGLWHGANVTFVVWGALNGVYLVLEKLIAEKFPKLDLLNAKGIIKFGRILITFVLVCIAWAFFRAANVHDAIFMLRKASSALFGNLEFAKLNLRWIVFCLTWILFEISELKFNLLNIYVNLNNYVRIAFAIVLFSIIILFAELNPKAFIYFQF